MSEQSRLRALLLLSIELRRLDGRGTLPSRLCLAGCRVLGGDGAALAIDRQGLERLVLHATDELATDLDELQEVAGDGPSHEAVAHGRVATGGPSTWDERWPAFADQLQVLAYDGYVLAVPLLAPDVVVGVLTVHRRAPFDGDAAELAEPIGHALGAALVVEPDHLHEDDLGPAWADRAVVHQATGMVVAQAGVGADDALVLLRGYAFSHGLRLQEVTRDVVERRIDFRDTMDEGE